MNELDFCIDYLKKYNKVIVLPTLSKEEQFRYLINITYPINLSEEYYKNESIVLKNILDRKNILDINLLNFKNNIALVKYDITLINSDAIVNAGNSELLGCFVPLHKCVDNAIHSFSGLKVRRDLIKIKENIKEVKNGIAISCLSYNLPSKYIIHTVGPCVNYKASEKDKKDLKACYINSLKEAIKLNLKSISFPSISTGLYSYPIEEACIIAYDTVYKYINDNKLDIKVIFVTYRDKDYLIYKKYIDSYDKFKRNNR